MKNENHSFRAYLSCNWIKLGIAYIYCMSVREISKSFPWEKLRSVSNKKRAHLRKFETTSPRAISSI